MLKVMRFSSKVLTSQKVRGWYVLKSLETHHEVSIFRKKHTLTSKQQGGNTGPSSSKHLNEERQFPPWPL